MKKYNTSSGYSIIAAVLMIWFLLVLTTSTLNLVLQEMRDWKGRQDYLKAYHGAEWALELALLQIKELGYWYDNLWIFSDENILWDDILSPIVSYDFDSATLLYTWSLLPWESEIIPLFWISDAWVTSSISDMTFDIESWNLSWNLIWKKEGISGIESFNSWDPKLFKTIEDTLDGNKKFILDSQDIGVFLSSNTWSYLTVFNSSSFESTFTVGSTSSFTKPIARISSSAKVWKYKQNLETSLDNTEFLGILKYSIYSGF